MAERTLHATLKKRLINNEAFAYAHLIKYERPHPPLKNGKHSTDAKRYAYLTDAAINIDYNDGSLSTDGTANGSQTYIADKIYKIGSYSETIESKATGMTLELGSESLNNSFAFSNPAMTATQIDLSTKMILETPKPPEDGTISMDYYCFLRFHKTNIKNYEGVLKAFYEFREAAKEVIEECCRGAH